MNRRVKPHRHLRHHHRNLAARRKRKLATAMFMVVLGMGRKR